MPIHTFDEKCHLVKPYNGADIYAWKMGAAIGAVRSQGGQLIAEIDA